MSIELYRNLDSNRDVGNGLLLPAFNSWIQ